jgi:hypothetical protein
MRRVNIIDNYCVVVRQGKRLAVDPDGSGIEVRVEPDRHVRICPVLSDAIVVAGSEVSDHVLTARSVLPPLKPTWGTAPHDEKVQRLVGAGGMAAEGRDYRR